MGNLVEINTIHLKVRNKLTDLLYPTLLSTIPSLLVVAALLVFKMNGHVNTTYLVAWLAAFVAVVACQGGLAIWFNKTRDSERWDHLYYKLLIADVVMVSLLWGTAAVLFMPEDTIGQSCLIFVLAFVAGGGSLYLASSYLAGTLYATGILIPLVASLVYSFFSQTHHEVYFNISIGLICFWTMLLIYSYSRSKLVAENYKNKLVNKALSEDLSMVSDELEKLNLVLRAEKEKLFLSPTHNKELQQAINSQLQQTDITVGVDTHEVAAIKFLQSRAYSRRHQQGLAIFSININNYQSVKETYGDEAANLLMKTAAIRLLYCKRETDNLCRIDENRFLLVISELQFGTEIKTIVAKILKMFGEKTIIADSKVQIDASMGISLFPIHSEDLPELIKKSEIALSNLLAVNSDIGKPAFLIYDEEKMGVELKKLSGTLLP